MKIENTYKKQQTILAQDEQQFQLYYQYYVFQTWREDRESNLKMLWSFCCTSAMHLFANSNSRSWCSCVFLYSAINPIFLASNWIAINSNSSLARLFSFDSLSACCSRLSRFCISASHSAEKNICYGFWTIWTLEFYLLDRIRVWHFDFG